MTFKAVLIGLGSVGLDYDLGLGDVILTHAKAIQEHSAFKLIAGVDKSEIQRSKLEQNYSVPAFSDIRCALRENPDIVVVATPTKTHRPVIDTVLEVSAPKVLLCEKPFSGNLNDANYIVRLAANRSTTIIVNYMRCFEPGSMRVKDKIRSGELGERIFGVGRYTGDLINNGSHMVNLLHYWLGAIIDVKPFAVNPNSQPERNTLDLLLEFNSGSVFLISNRITEFNLFEVDLCGPEGRLYYQNSGQTISWSNVNRDQKIQGSKNLITQYEDLPNDFYNYQWYVYDHIYQYLTNPTYPLPSTAEDALLTLEYLDQWLN